MTILETDFRGVFLIKPKIFNDNRGYFFESFRLDLVEKVLERKIIFCQENQSFSKKGVIKGLHYQLPPFSQSKLVRVIEGSVIDVIVDIRRGSPTFGKYITVELSSENQLQVFIPKGFAHGYITNSEYSIVNYKVDQYYNKIYEKTITYDDSQIDIDWKIKNKEIILSDKDRNNLSLEKSIVFDYNNDLYE
jgi:dTDP-4-dehydrorhamnose 3,5-epimerase